MAEEEIEGKGFVIRDRRRFTEEGEIKEVEEPDEKAAQPEPEAPEGEKIEPEAPPEESEQAPLPEINLSTFIFRDL